MRTQQELYDIFITELQSQDATLTDDNIGSLIDVIGGAVSTAVSEIQEMTVDEFKKTFFDTANGPEVTGGPDDLETLAVDHFGDDFERPEGAKASGTVTFSRPTNTFGNVNIPAGTVVKTPANAAGSSQRYETEADVLLTNLTINASVTAQEIGTDGNAEPNTVTQIESTLLDSSIVVNNASGFAGGEEPQGDDEYRETIRTLLQSLKGGTLAAIEAKAKSVPGVEFAKAVETLIYVKEWDIGGGVTVGDYFSIPRAKVYIADANGNSSDSLVAAVVAALETVRAAGVRVTVIGGTALELDWSGTIALNPSGPNYATLQTDPTMVVDVMVKYLSDFNPGQSFIRNSAKNYIMSVFGPSGTDDITNFTNNAPIGDVNPTVNQKIVPGTVEIV